MCSHEIEIAAMPKGNVVCARTGRQKVYYKIPGIIPKREIGVCAHIGRQKVYYKILGRISKREMGVCT